MFSVSCHVILTSLTVCSCHVGSFSSWLSLTPLLDTLTYQVSGFLMLCKYISVTSQPLEEELNDPLESLQINTMELNTHTHLQ